MVQHPAMTEMHHTMPLLCTRKQAAQTLGISLRSLDYLIASRQLPTRRIGRRTQIPYSALQKFVRADHPHVRSFNREGGTH